MIEDQGIPASIPFLKTNEEQAVKVRKRLEDIFSNISLVHDVIVMSIEVCEANSGDFNPRDVARPAAVRSQQTPFAVTGADFHH